MEGWADRRVSIVGGGEGACPPSPRNGKKDVVRRNFNLFHLCFNNEIRGESTNTAYMQNGMGWADRRLSMVGGGWGEGALPPSLGNEKKRGCQRKY